MSNQSVEERYEKAFTQASSLHPIFPNAAREQMAQMVEATIRANKNFDKILSTNQTSAVKGGFLAEEFHAETFNLDAILDGNDNRAYTDKYAEWKNYEWNGKQLGTNDIPDIVIANDKEVVSTAQSKYYSTPEETARQMSEVKDNAPKYQDVDTLLGPSDQINPTDDIVSVAEHAEAKADALKNTGGNTADIDAYEQTASKTSDTISDGQSSSTSMTKQEAEALGAGDKSKIVEVENKYKTQSTLQQMGNAAVGAAAMSAVVSGSINTIRYIQLAKEGKISAEEATVKIVGETVAAAADSAVKASANAGVQSLMVRYGSETAVKEVLANEGLKAMMKSNAVTVGVVCAVDAVKDLVQLGMGNLTKEQFFDRQGKGVMTTSAGVVGGSLGMAGASSLAGALGASSGSLAMTAANLIGGLSGGIIAGLAMTIAIENGIEKPYRNLLENSANLHEAASELEKISRNVLQGQVLFTKFVEADVFLEQELESQFNNIDNAGKNALDIIMKI